MKYLVSILFIMLIAACSVNQKMNVQEMESEITDDSLTYELIVLDPGFESWFITHQKPEWFHSQQYYESWNERYVHAWNYGSIGYRHKQLMDCYIDYNPRVDYGLDINHKLFYYFQYVEGELKIPLVMGSPRAAR